MATLIFITHPEVVVDANTPVTQWGLNHGGRVRAQRFATSNIMTKVGAIWASSEVKAQQTALCLATPLGLSVKTDAQLGENDRTATGFLPPDAFEAAADAFFATPDRSFNGWEKAIDAQMRIENCVRRIATDHKSGDLAIVSHGAVGTLLYCALMGFPINRAYDQPAQGHFWTASLSDLIPIHGWRRLD